MSNSPSAETPRLSRPLLLIGALAMTALDAVLLALALGGVAALAAHARALALVAVWGVSNLVLGMLRPVGVRDPLETRSDSRFVLFALFLIPLITPAVAAFGERHEILRLPGRATLGWTGVAISAAGLALRVAAMAQLGRRFAPIAMVQRDHVLETGGIYARVRHPGYLGSFMATLGGALAFTSATGLPLVLLMALVQRARVRREEELLERHFGDRYRAYRHSTGAFLPHLLPPRDS